MGNDFKTRSFKKALPIRAGDFSGRKRKVLQREHRKEEENPCSLFNVITKGRGYLDLEN